MKNNGNKTRHTGAPMQKTGESSPSKRRDVPASERFPVVGVGASAGGLEAFTNFLRELPADTGMGFVLVQHLDPDHDSALTDLLSKATSMPVSEVADDMRVEPDHIYVIPPNAQLSISGGCLKTRLREKQPGAQHAIDFFFESLAHDVKERAMGVVLSGTASDGTIGIEAIKSEGGIVFAQDDSAKYDSMPRSAIAAGCVDFVLSPAGIARELTRIARHPCYRPSDAVEASDEKTNLEPPETGAHTDAFQSILSCLRERRGVDFSSYKPNTVERRIARRMVLNKKESHATYADFLEANTEEIDALYADVLIGVTSFFRNPDAFEALKERTFPQVVEKAGDGPIRLWVAGCSSGQEVYSIAMAYAEYREQAQVTTRLQIFATDLSEPALERARAGLYGESLVGDVTSERLERFFVEEDGGYRVKKALRESVIFARHNLVADPPFSRMHIISCRNLLIYFDSVLQKQVLPIFHYSLQSGGFLFLGASESVGSFTDLFEPADAKQRIFLRKSGPTPPLHRFTPAGTKHKSGEKKSVRSGIGERSPEREADRLAVKRFAPPGVLIDANLRILQFRGATGPYLEPRAGKATLQILNMVREGLMLPLRAAIEEARKTSQPVRKENVRVFQEGSTRSIAIEVIPVKNVKEPCFLIAFEAASRRPASDQGAGVSKQGEAEHASEPVETTSDGDALTIAGLEAELAETREYLESLEEQYETNSEELQVSNEEAHSANEELQSINEELETSKEELESTNEELTTVNEELSHRNTDLNCLNDDLENLQNSVQTAVVVLGHDLVIRRFNPLAEKKFHLMATDLGRTIASIRFPFDFPDLEDWISGCIETASTRNKEVKDGNGVWYSLRVLPYRTNENQIDGAVLVLVDIDALKRSEQELAAANHYAQAIVDHVSPLVVLDSALRVVSANDSFLKHFQLSREKTEKHLLFEMGDSQWEIPILRETLERTLPVQGEIRDFEIEHDFRGIGRRTLLLDASQLDHLEITLLRIDDVTTERDAVRSLEELNNTLEVRVEKRTREVRARVAQLQKLSLQLVDAEFNERHRLAILLHDDIQQTLVAVKMHVGIRSESLGAEEQAQRLAFVREMLDHAIQSTRSLACDLAPPVLQHGLGAALEWLAKWARERYLLQVELKTEEAAEPEDAGMRNFLFENVRELLLNVVKHAETNKVAIRLTRRHDMIHVQVEDSGRGFNVKAFKAKTGEIGFGLSTLGERLHLLGGQIEVKSSPGKGTCIELVVPVKADVSEH